jgi:hypothetical protein
MGKLLLRVALVVLAVVVGLGTLFWVCLWLLGIGASEVVLKNLDSERTVRVTVMQVTEGRDDVLDESQPIELGAGATHALELEHKGDAEVRIRVVDARGDTRLYTVHEYLGGHARKIEIELLGGQVKRVRARGGPLTDYQDAHWTAR